MKRLRILLLLVLLPGLARAQTVTVSAGVVLTVSGAAVLDLEGATFDFGGTNETASLSETGGGHVAGGTLTATRTLANPSFEDVAPTQNNSGLDATVTFHYDEDELNGIDESTLVLFRGEDAGSTWERVAGTVDAVPDAVTATGVDHLSRWMLAGGTAPLPVELVAVDARLDGAAAVLTWQTAMETNNAGFAVEMRVQADSVAGLASAAPRPGEGVWWERAFVAGAGTTAEARHYTATVADVEPGLYRFRLKQIDYDGAFAYSPEVELTLEAPRVLALHGAYPNLFNPATTLSFTVPAEGRTVLLVYDVLGPAVARVFDGEAKAGRLYRLRFGGETFASGTYLTVLRYGGRVETGCFVLAK